VRTEFKLFGGIAAFLYVTAIIYGIWTYEWQEGIEWAGFVALVLSATLCAMCGGYFWFVARRVELRPEDRPDADISEGAGELGFFSPGSYWPVTLGAAVALAGLGIVFWATWLIALGFVAVIFATGGLLFEYYTGSRAH